MSDEELLLAYKESDKADYIEELFIRYLPLNYGVYLKYLKDSDKAREAVMLLFENLVYTIANNDIDEFRPWIYNAVKRHCYQLLQNEDYFAAVDFNNNHTELDDIIHRLEEYEGGQTDLLTSCLNKLPERQRLSITYFFVDKLSYAEICGKTGYTLKNVKNYIYVGKQNLKLCLENNDR